VGEKNIPKQPYLIASKHQSVFETIVFWSIFYIPTYILKKELLSIPFFGIYLKRMKMISISRKDGVSALKKIVRKSEYHLKHKRNIIIFPEGTRTEYGAKKENYSPGVAALYTGTNIPVLPIAVNSGKFWPNKGDKKPGVITIKILPPIEPGLDRKVFLKKLYDTIENASAKL
jgi:1-acyl-sn-glycerol-3-phosphate acyltransferase